MANDYNAVVVGGGPAGSSAAYHLARSGAKVALMEKARHPREKVCGECMTPRAIRAAFEMGLEQVCRREFYRIRGMRIAYMERRPREFPMPSVHSFEDCMYTVRRPRLDHLLLGSAGEAGAEVVQECRVTGPLVDSGDVIGVRAVRQGGEVEVTADVVIGADGVNSTLGRSLGLLVNDERNMVIAVRQLFDGVEALDDFVELFYKDETKPGYAWLFPMSGTVANVGVGTYVNDIRRYGLDLQGLLRTLVSNTSVAARFDRARPVSPPRGSLIRMGMKCSRVERAGLILVGDAAGMVNPSNGEGISYALETGKMAAEHLLDNSGGSSVLHHDPEKNPFRKKLDARYGRYFSTLEWGAKHLLSRSTFWNTHQLLGHSRLYRKYYMVLFSNLRNN